MYASPFLVERSGVRTRAAANLPIVVGIAIMAAMAVLAAACTSSDSISSDGTVQAETTDAGRSSGDLEQDPAAAGQDAGGTQQDDQAGDGSDPDSDSEDQASSSGRSPSQGDDQDSGGDDSGDSGEGPETTQQTTTDSSADTETSVAEPEIRADGLELVFADGSLGAAKLGSTIDEMSAALGPAYEVAAEENIRVDFPSGYSISRDGEVMFWAIEEDGVISVIMSSHKRVGLDSGLRPGMVLADAIALHGEPSLTLGPEVREFASFEDGTGGGPLSILVAIGQFGGPVGVYETFDAGSEATGYEPEGANIKELWFWNR